MKNDIQLHGTIFFEPATGKWIGSGTGWWIEKTSGHHAKITFEDSLSNINQNGKVDAYNVGEDGFILTWKDFSDATCIASFSVSGTKVSYVPNDRALSNEDSVADIYATGLLFDYEAKHGGRHRDGVCKHFAPRKNRCQSGYPGRTRELLEIRYR